jgi:predicted ribosomally synthesized peptide with SipW-like signal peptide
MKRKLLISLALLGAMAIMVSLGSSAWFDDLEVSRGNTFTAGTIDIWVDGQAKWSISHAVALPDGDAFLKPCQIGYIEFPVENRGNNPADIWKRISDATSTENGITEPEQTYYNKHPGSQAKRIQDYMDFDLSLGSADTTPPGHVIIPESNPANLNSVLGQWIYLGQLQPGETMWVKQSFHLRVDTETVTPNTGLPHMNWAQSDQLVFDEQILGLQVTGAPNPTPELPGYGRP